MEGGPAFTKKETEICKLSCESMQAGMRSPLEPSPSYINMSTAARSSMMMPPTCPATSISSCRADLQQQEQQLIMISNCSSIKPSNLQSNPNPNPNPSIRSTILNTGENPFVYRPTDLIKISHDCSSLTAEQISPASPYFNPSPNPNPNPNPSPKSSPNLSTPLPVDDRYTNSTLISAKSPVNHILIKHQRQLHDQSLFDHDHQLGLTSSDDQLFGGFRLLPLHASSPLFSEGLQASWSPMITDYPYMSTQREAAALMSPAPEITGLGDLHEAEMSLFTSAITARRCNLFEESSSRKGLMYTSELPSTAGSAIDSGIEKQRALELPVIHDQNDLHDHGIDQSPRHHSASLGGAHFVRKPTASVHRSAGAGSGFSGGESEGLKHASPAATEMSSSSASELQDEEDSNTGNQAKPVETHATYDKLDGSDAPDLGKPEANMDNKPSKKPRKKGQRRVREARVALLTKSEVEHLEDGYRWRKYGQKAVKNSPHPRSYYRCTNSKCFVKKRVERCNEDPSLVVTTYEGQHTHHSPAVLRGTHDMLDPLNISAPLGTLNYHNNATFIPWHSSLNILPPSSTHSPSHFPTTTSINATINQLFRPLLSAPNLLLSKPLSFPTTPFSIPTNLDHSNSLSRISMLPPHPQIPHHFMPRPQHAMQTSHSAHDQLHLTQNVASQSLPSSLVDKGLLDDMLSHACGHNPSPSASS